MASVSFEKLKTPQEVKAMLRHCDKEERKKTKTHSNTDINLEATASNRQYPRDYKTTCKRYDDRIAYLDSGSERFVTLSISSMDLIMCYSVISTVMKSTLTKMQKQERIVKAVHMDTFTLFQSITKS